MILQMLPPCQVHPPAAPPMHTYLIGQLLALCLRHMGDERRLLHLRQHLPALTQLKRRLLRVFTMHACECACVCVLGAGEEVEAGACVGGGQFYR